eukprot:gene4407-3206_t
MNGAVSSTALPEDAPEKCATIYTHVHHYFALVFAVAPNHKESVGQH